MKKSRFPAAEKHSTSPVEQENAPPSPSDFVSVEEFAALIGVSKWTIYESIQRDSLPGAFRVGRRIRIHLPTAMVRIAGGEL